MHVVSAFFWPELLAASDCERAEAAQGQLERLGGRESRLLRHCSSVVTMSRDGVYSLPSRLSRASLVSSMNERWEGGRMSSHVHRN